MFTGLITDMGTVREVTLAMGHQVKISTSYDTSQLVNGSSIACDGCCLTAVAVGSDWFVADVSSETLSRTTLCNWQTGTQVNLERSLRLGDEMGGHLVTGHVDGMAEVVSAQPEKGSLICEFVVDEVLSNFIAPKGSVALNGVSLTVNEVAGDKFSVNIIPHTKTHTNLGSLLEGQRVNMEVDLIARYVDRLAKGSS